MFGFTALPRFGQLAGQLAHARAFAGGEEDGFGDLDGIHRATMRGRRAGGKARPGGCQGNRIKLRAA